MCSAVRLLAVLGAVAAARAAGECTKPKITVPGAILDEDDDYHVRKGPFEVFCSSDSNNLLMSANSNELRTVVLNSTTVKTIFEGGSADLYIVRCQHSNDAGCYKVVSIIVEYTPNLNRFKCFSNNLYLTCSWCGSYGNNYTVYFADPRRPRLHLRICEGKILSRNDYSCESCDLSNLQWIYLDYMRRLVPLRLHMCNFLECIDQHVEVDVEAVTQLNAPKILDIRAHHDGALLIWQVPLDHMLKTFGVSDILIYYKIEYALAGVPPFQSVSNTTVFKMYPDNIKYTELKLPCPDKEYTVRISCRSARAGPEYMSDFAFTTVRSKPNANSAEDPKCEVNPGPVETPPVLVYKVQLLRQEVYENLAQFGELRRRLKEKLAEINKLIN